ncbi:MAG: hypothetical protein QXJ24_06790, partial [Thermoplasmatales archaeon]
SLYTGPFCPCMKTGMAEIAIAITAKTAIYFAIFLSILFLFLTAFGEKRSLGERFLFSPRLISINITN